MMMSERNSSLLVGLLRVVLHRGCAHDWLRHSGGIFTGMPWLSVITSALHAMPMSTIDMPRSTRLRAQNARISTYDATSSPKPSVVPVAAREA